MSTREGTQQIHRLIVRTDGAARGNPGPAAAGAVLLDADAPGGAFGAPVSRISEALGTTTNNVAEYVALVLALETAESLGARELLILLDSKLIVEQVLGHYRVRDSKLVPLHREVQERLARFERWAVRHVPRVENAAADGLANAALDRGARPGDRVRRWLPGGLFEEL